MEAYIYIYSYLYISSLLKERSQLGKVRKDERNRNNLQKDKQFNVFGDNGGDDQDTLEKHDLAIECISMATVADGLASSCVASPRICTHGD